MISALTIENFRCFKHLEVNNLGIVNLIVGTNNSGKTSLLEAVEIGASSHVSAVDRGLLRRGEVKEYFSKTDTLVPDYRQLCHNFQTNEPSKICLHSDYGEKNFHLQLSPLLQTHYQGNVYKAVFDWQFGEIKYSYTVKPNENIEPTISGPDIENFSPFQDVFFLSAESIPPDQVVMILDNNTLTDSEEIILEGMRIIDKRIERVASYTLHDKSLGLKRDGIKLKLSHLREPVTIGSLGDGVWRILTILLALTDSPYGYVLIDEIDTGLHYSVMAKMWKVVFETAKKLNVQVFATTHSRDCYESLASICREELAGDNLVTIQRLESGKSHPISYNEAEIITVAKRGLEVR